MAQRTGNALECYCPLSDDTRSRAIQQSGPVLLLSLPSLTRRQCALANDRIFSKGLSKRKRFAIKTKKKLKYFLPSSQRRSVCVVNFAKLVNRSTLEHKNYCRRLIASYKLPLIRSPPEKRSKLLKNCVLTLPLKVYGAFSRRLAVESTFRTCKVMPSAISTLLVLSEREVREKFWERPERYPRFIASDLCSWLAALVQTNKKKRMTKQIWEHLQFSKIQ